MQNTERLLTLAEGGNLPANALNSIRLLAEQFRITKVKIEDVTAENSSASDIGTTARRPKIRAGPENDSGDRFPGDCPGIGPITSSVLATTLPGTSGFKTARNLAAWLGLTPKLHSSGGKERLCRISKMGKRYICQVLHLGAMGIVAARRRRQAGDDWLWQLLEGKPVKLVAIALANRNAQTVWVLLKSGEKYQVARA